MAKTSKLKRRSHRQFPSIEKLIYILEKLTNIYLFIFFCRKSALISEPICYLDDDVESAEKSLCRFCLTKPTISVCSTHDEWQQSDVCEMVNELKVKLEIVTEFIIKILCEF